MSQENQVMIVWTKPKVRKLQKAYNEAVRDGEKTFRFEGHELLVGYAKYLLQYLGTLKQLKD